MRGTLRERFEAKVRHGPGDACSEWIGARGSRYGKIKVEGETRCAHRVAWELAEGPIPDGFCVCHTCDNGFCVKREHLFLGTHADNMADKVRKGRDMPPPRSPKRCRGEAHPKAVLTDAEIAAIRQRRGEVSQVELARDYGVTQAYISKVQRGVSR